jgi:hypothetical protein
MPRTHTDEFRCRIRCIANRATKAAAIQFGHLLLPPISAAILQDTTLRTTTAMTTLKISIASRRPGRPPKVSQLSPFRGGCRQDLLWALVSEFGDWHE